MSDEPDWRVGDRVFAPWELQWLYSGTILCLDRDEERGDVAFIKFDDGDRALMPVSVLKTVAIRRGDQAFCRRDRDVKMYFPALVLGFTDDGLRVRYFDDHSEDLVPVSHCRLLAVQALE
jgi:hypothetical protein